jgi:hypothetical protein
MSDARDWRDTYGAEVVATKAPWGTAHHLKVYRHDEADGIPWDDLQRIKNDVLGADVIAVEIYPPESDVVNTYNMRHLWTVPKGVLGGYNGGIGFGWGL